MDFSDREYLQSNCAELNVTVFDEIDSTNAYAKRQIGMGNTENALFVADYQTMGHGRFNRKFVSPKGCGIYMSFMLKLGTVCESTPLITTAAAVAVCRALKRFCDKKFGIKWVNDIYLGDKKVCGILTENLLDTSGKNNNYTVVGIGINIFSCRGGYGVDAPNATSVFAEGEDENISRNDIILAIKDEFLPLFNNLADKSFINEYKERILGVGKKITVIQNGKKTPAVMLGVDDNLHLTARLENGEVKRLSTGEISIKLQ